MAHRSLVDRQVDEIINAEEFGEEDDFECLCDELYTHMSEEPGGLPDPEFFGIGNIPLCGSCEAEREKSLEGSR